MAAWQVEHRRNGDAMNSNARAAFRLQRRSHCPGGEFLHCTADDTRLPRSVCVLQRSAVVQVHYEDVLDSPESVGKKGPGRFFASGGAEFVLHGP